MNKKSLSYCLFLSLCGVGFNVGQALAACPSSLNCQSAEWRYALKTYYWSAPCSSKSECVDLYIKTGDESNWGFTIGYYNGIRSTPTYLARKESLEWTESWYNCSVACTSNPEGAGDARHHFTVKIDAHLTNGSVVPNVYTKGATVWGGYYCPPETWLGSVDGTYMCVSLRRCPISPLTELPNDPCTLSLEAGSGRDINGSCPPLSLAAQEQERCVADKITSLGIPYGGPTATVRTMVYQRHLREIWDKWKALKKLSPEEMSACSEIMSDVEREKKQHGLVYRPAMSSAHAEGSAFDVSNGTINSVLYNMLNDANYIGLGSSADAWGFGAYLESASWNPPSCNVQWGGTFGDNVHFQAQ